MPAIVVIVSALFLLTGCESFRRKFVRAKKAGIEKEPMVIAPRDYSAHPFPSDVLYRQYFTYWKAWSQDLVRSLDERASHKKNLDCVGQCLQNLSKMKSYLQDAEAARLDVFMQKTERLKQQIESQPNLPASQATSLRYDAERIQSGINRQFDGRKMKDALKSDGGPSAT
jgi:hypothetical protein